MKADGRTALGAFVLGGLLLTVAAIVLFGKFNLFHPTIRAAVVFQDSIAGLSVGAPVTFRGVRVGAVENIALQFDTKSNTAFIPVTIGLESNRALVSGKSDGGMVDLSALISIGLRAELNVQSFVTGQSEINLDFDPDSAPILHATVTKLPEIPTRQSTLQRAREQLSQLPLREMAENTTATMQSLRALAEKLDKDLPPLVQSLKVSSDNSAQAVDTARQTIQELQGRLDLTLSAIGQLAATGDRQLTERGAELHTVLTTSNQTMQQIRDLAVDIKGLTASRGVSRANLESALRDLAAAAASLRGLANDVEHDPQLLLTGRRR